MTIQDRVLCHPAANYGTLVSDRLVSMCDCDGTVISLQVEALMSLDTAAVNTKHASVSNTHACLQCQTN